jgi:hypothetical protein
MDFIKQFETGLEPLTDGFEYNFINFKPQIIQFFPVFETTH